MGKKTHEPRTKGNVKPSKSDNAAQFLANKKFDHVQGFAGLAGGLGFMRSDHMDSDVDPDIRHIFRRLDKKDTLTKQKALQELLGLTETKEENALLGAFPYWPRLYSRLSMDDDNKVRAVSHKVMSSLATRCGRNMAPHLKSILPVWILGRGDDYDPAATAATHAFESTFPPSKRADALRHAWTEVFDLAEEALFSKPPSSASQDAEVAFADLSRYLRSVALGLKALTLLYPLVKGKEEAAARLLQLIRDKRFWFHFSVGSSSSVAAPEGGVAANDIVRVAYFDLIVCLCKESAEFVRQPACAGAICEVVLRDIGVDIPLVAGSLWEAILVVMEVIEEQVWRHVSFKKSFFPNLCQVLAAGGYGCARKIFPCLLPLFAQLRLGENQELRQTGVTLLGKAWEGLHLPRVIVAKIEASAIAKAYMECCRYLISECWKRQKDSEASEDLRREIRVFIEDFAGAAEFECLIVDKSFQAFGPTIADQFVLLLGFLNKRSGSESEGGLFGFTVRKLLNFVSQKREVKDSDYTTVLSMMALIDSLARSNDLAVRKGKDSNVSFKRMNDSKVSIVGKMAADWAPSVIGELATVLLTNCDSDCAGSWLPILAAFPEITELTQWFDMSPPLKAMMTGLERILIFYDDNHTIFFSGIGAKSFIFERSMTGYCKLLVHYTTPTESGELLCDQFDRMENTANRLTFLSQVLPLMLDNLTPHHAAAVHKRLEPQISEWSRSLIAAVFTRLDSGAEASFRGVIDMLLHHLPPSMLSLWAFRSEILSHVTACVAKLDPDVVLIRTKCRRLVSMLCHLLEKCGNEVMEGDERTEALEEVILQLSNYFLLLLSFETQIASIKKENEEERGEFEVVDREDSETLVRLKARNTVISFVQRRLESDGISSVKVNEAQFIPSLVNSVIDGVVEATSDDSAFIVGEEFGVELIREMLLIEDNQVEDRDDAQNILLSFVFDRLITKCKISFKALDQSVAMNNNFNLSVTSRDKSHYRYLIRGLYLTCSLASVSPSLLNKLKHRQSEDGILSSLIYSTLFISTRLSDLGIENSGGCLIEKLRNFDETHRKQLLKDKVLLDLTNGTLKNSCLWLQVMGNLLCRQELLSDCQGLVQSDLLRLDWLTMDEEKEKEHALTVFILKDLPCLLTFKSDATEDLLLSVESRLELRDKSAHNNSCIMRILAELAILESDQCLLCMGLFQRLHDLHEDQLFSGEDEIEEGQIPIGWRLETVISAMRLMQQTVRHCPEELAEEQWDLILCSCVSWLSLLSEADESVKSTIEGQRFAYHLLSMLAVLGATVPYSEGLPDRIRVEWNDFYVGHLYDGVLNQFNKFLHSDVIGFRSSPQTIVLCDAVARTPVEHLLVWKLSPKLRIDETSNLKDQSVLTLVNTLSPLLYPESSKTPYCVQVTACCILHTLAHSGKLSVQNEEEIEESETFEPPASLMDVLRSCDHLCGSLKEAAEFGGGAIGVERLLEATMDEMREADEVVVEPHENFNRVLACLTGYLMTWRILLASFAACSPIAKARFASWLAETGRFDQLQQILFRILPLNPSTPLVNQLLKRSDSSASGPKFAVSMSLFEREVSMMMDPAVPFMRRTWLFHLAASVYMQTLRSAPALMRQWWLGLSKKESSIVERYTERLISPILVTSETDHVNARAGEFFPDNEVMQVKGKSSIREIHAIYRVTDEHRTELLITLPTNYPLGPITVQTFKKIGISAQQWRSLQLQMTTFLQNQNGTVLEGLSLWKRNIDTKMEGVEDCMICFSILHGSNYQLPRMSCHTCKKKFHSACLYKWFQTSQNHTCPLCRNMFEMSNMRH